jgi:DNA replication protein DnaC
MYSWIKIHQEAIQRILGYRQKQSELLTILREMEQQGLKVISLQDKDANGNAIPLAEIDPFTFLASFNRGVTEKNRRENWNFLKKKWDLKAPVPDDFDGIPTLHNMSSWLFPFSAKRKKDHVEHLWEIASRAVDRDFKQEDEKSFNECLKLGDIGISSLTIGLFWVNPEKFLPTDKKTTAYGKAKGIMTEPEDYQSYQEWMKEMGERFGHDYPQISYDANLFAKSRMELNTDQMKMLWARFQDRIKGFSDFQNPGSDFVDKETSYKRAILKKFQQELGVEKLTELVDQGQGTSAVKEIARVLTSNLVNYHAWDSTLGVTDQVSCEVLREYLKTASGSYHGSESTNSLFEANARHNLKPNWDAMSTLLWALRPEDFFPIKISFYRKLSKELGYELPPGRPDSDKLHSLIEFGRAFWKALEPYKPSDWVDVQSFIWCVCPDSDKELEPVKHPVPETGVAYWWLNANPKIWNFEQMRIGQKQTYTSHNEKGNKRQRYKYFQEVKPLDIVVGYVTTPQKEVVAICKITKGLNKTATGEEIEFEKTEQLDKPIGYETLQTNPDLAKSEPIINNQGSLFKLTEQEYEIIRSLIDEANIPVKIKIESYDKKKAMQGLFLAEVQFDEMLDALKEKKNVVLQGAPGVGKTYVAKRLAHALIGSNDPRRIEMIQFHQSYSYEDFIQGFRPTPRGHFDLKYGIFHQFCRRAQREELAQEPYVFIVDEINRGNLSKIFGELMMLIEPDKRGKDYAIPLAYSQDSDEKFYIPENLHLIGMMNTADRSLAMVDYALRRRFRFITLRPEFASGAFNNFLVVNGAKPELVEKIVARMNKLNEVIAADTKNLGPGYQIGHSYFCPQNVMKLDEKWYCRVVETEILPLIQEYWFDNDQKVEELRSALLA